MKQIRLVIGLLFGLFVGPVQQISAVSISESGLAPPAAAVFPSSSDPTAFSELIVTGDFNTVTADYGTEGALTSYNVPDYAVCDAATVSAVRIHGVTTSFTAIGASTFAQDAGGIAIALYDQTGTIVGVDTVNDGTRTDGPFFLVLDATFEDRVGNGWTNGIWTTVTDPMPGGIDFTLDTAGMTVGDLEALTIRYEKDARDLPVLGDPNSIATSMSATQPTISVTYDDGPCDDDSDGFTNATEDIGGSDRNDECDPSVTAVGASDCDNDGLSASQEATAGTDPSNPDSDGDGLSDGAEVLGSSPSDPLDPCDPNPDGNCLAETGAIPWISFVGILLGIGVLCIAQRSGTIYSIRR